LAFKTERVRQTRPIDKHSVEPYGVPASAKVLHVNESNCIVNGKDDIQQQPCQWHCQWHDKAGSVGLHCLVWSGAQRPCSRLNLLVWSGEEEDKIDKSITSFEGCYRLQGALGEYDDYDAIATMHPVATRTLIEPCRPHLVAYCPTMDLVATVMVTKKGGGGHVDVSRLNGQRVFGASFETEVDGDGDADGVQRNSEDMEAEEGKEADVEGFVRAVTWRRDGKFGFYFRFSFRTSFLFCLGLGGGQTL
jgi:hypothetical protein